jgi:hypothetical protein
VPGRHCVSSVEALDGDPQSTTLLGFSDRIERRETSFRRDELSIAQEGFGARAPGTVVSGTFPNVTLAVEAPRMTSETETREHLLWVRIPRVLTYWTSFGALRFAGSTGIISGLGLVEHAYGTAIPFDLGRVRLGWQWDVLRFDEGGFAAGLAVEIAGHLRGLRGTVRLGDASRRRTSSIALSWGEPDEEAGRVVPLRWEGIFRTRDGVLTYEARKATPLAPEVPDGGFFGFSFEGQWRPRAGLDRAVSGTGFTEYRAAPPRSSPG